MILYTQNKKQITVDDNPFASGGQGSIHHVLSPVYNQPLVVKLYLTPQKASVVQQRIEYMCNNNPLSNAQQMVQESFSWPLEPLYEANGTFVGFSMNLIKDSQPLVKLTLPKGFNDPVWNKFNITDPNSYNTRLRLLYNVCQALDVLDQYGQYRIIDLKPINMMLKNNGHTVIIDIDSFQISQGNNVLFFAEAATEEYCPPEFHQGKIDFNNDFVEPSWDYFAFAVTAYQLLFCIHPFQASHPSFQTQPELIQNGMFVHGRNKSQLHVIPAPHGNFTQFLGKPLQDLFIRCFDNGHTNPNQRPNFVEWSNEILKEIHRINNQNITAGTNQPTQRRQPKNQPNPNLTPHVQQHPNPAPQSLASIQSFTVSPGGVNVATLTWSVTNAQSVYVNGHAVGMTGSMQIQAVSGSQQIEAIDVNGIKVSQTLLFNMPILIRNFSHKICNGYIELSWDVQGAITVDINNQNVAASGSFNIPLSIGTQTLTATSSTGYILSQDTHINCVAYINDFHYNLFRTSAELEWEVWNAVNIELNGVKVNALDKKKVSLKSNNYTIEAIDSFGNKTNNSQTINVSTQVRRFEIIPGKYTAKAYWDLWYVQYAHFENERISLKGEMILPLMNKTFNLEMFDFNGIVSNIDHKLTAPDNVTLMPVQELVEPNHDLSDIQKLTTQVVPIINPEKINELNSHLIDAISLNNSVIRLQIPYSKIKVPVFLNSVKNSFNKAVELNITKQKGYSVNKNRSYYFLTRIMQHAAIIIGFIVTFFSYLKKI